MNLSDVNLIQVQLGHSEGLFRRSSQSGPIRLPAAVVRGNTVLRSLATSSKTNKRFIGQLLRLVFTGDDVGGGAVRDGAAVAEGKGRHDGGGVHRFFQSQHFLHLCLGIVMTEEIIGYGNPRQLFLGGAVMPHVFFGDHGKIGRRKAEAVRGVPVVIDGGQFAVKALPFLRCEELLATGYDDDLRIAGFQEGFSRQKRGVPSGAEDVDSCTYGSRLQSAALSNDGSQIDLKRTSSQVR